MKLDQFFPYRATVLAQLLSRSIAQVYEERFGLTRDEWRILATLAETSPIKAVRLGPEANLDKMQVSRALKRMEEADLVARSDDPEDGRGYLVSLRPAGRALHRKIVPVVLAREAFLLQDLDAAERQALDSAIDKILKRGQDLDEQG